MIFTFTSIHGFICDSDYGFEFTFTFDCTLSFTELFKEGTFGIVGEGKGGFACDESGRFHAHFLAFEVTFEGIEEETVVWDGEPGRAQRVSE